MDKITINKVLLLHSLVIMECINVQNITIEMIKAFEKNLRMFLYL